MIASCSSAVGSLKLMRICRCVNRAVHLLKLKLLVMLMLTWSQKNHQREPLSLLLTKRSSVATKSDPCQPFQIKLKMTKSFAPTQTSVVEILWLRNKHPSCMAHYNWDQHQRLGTTIACTSKGFRCGSRLDGVALCCQKISNGSGGSVSRS